jgi:hypothetical protein
MKPLKQGGHLISANLSAQVGEASRFARFKTVQTETVRLHRSALFVSVCELKLAPIWVPPPWQRDGSRLGGVSDDPCGPSLTDTYRMCIHEL